MVAGGEVFNFSFNFSLFIYLILLICKGENLLISHFSGNLHSKNLCKEEFSEMVGVVNQEKKRERVKERLIRKSNPL